MAQLCLSISNMLVPSPVFNEANSLQLLIEITNKNLTKYFEQGICTQSATRQWRNTFQQEIAGQVRGLCTVMLAD
jgi:hypothetical protein